MPTTNTIDREHNNRELTDAELLGVVAGAMKTVGWAYDDEAPKATTNSVRGTGGQFGP